MSFIDSWSLLTGLASLIALFLYLNEKYLGWRKYTTPALWAFSGFAIGRITGSITPQVNQSLQDTHLVGVLLILLPLLGIAVIFLVVLANRGEAWLAYSVFSLILTLGALPLIRDYLSANPIIPTGDYLKLAQMKEKSGDEEEAIRYMELFSHKIDDKELQKQIENKIKVLRSQQISQSLNPTSQK